MPGDRPAPSRESTRPGISSGERLVFDASVVLKLYLEEEGSAAADGLFRRTRPLAPDLVVAEVANALWKSVRTGRLGAGDALEAAAGLPALFDSLVPSAELVERACALALGLDHPVYDCLYLALAQKEGITLVTADRSLQEKAARGADAVRVVLLGSGPPDSQ